MRIEILCTGDEVLSGKTVNTNYSHIARRLNENGFATQRGTVVGDDRASLVTAFLQAAQTADAVIVNGGLGPTVDDLSQEAAAEAAGVALELHREWMERIAAWYRSRDREMPANNNRQAMLPQGAEFIDNPIGTACGFALNIGGARFFFTPGVPSEMRRMLDEQVLPRLEDMRGYRLATRLKRFHLFGIGESRADQLLDGVEQIVADGSVKLGFQSHFPQLEVKLTVGGRDEAKLAETLEPVERAVRERVGAYILSEDDRSVEDGIIDALAQRNAHITVLEMHTGGAIVGRLLSAGDGRVSRGLVVADVNGLADFRAGESGGSIDGISEELAAQCARQLHDGGGVTRFALAVLSDLSGITDAEHPRAEVVYALYCDGAVTTRRAILPGRRNWVITGATELGLDFLRRCLHGLDPVRKIDFEQH